MDDINHAMKIVKEIMDNGSSMELETETERAKLVMAQWREVADKMHSEGNIWNDNDRNDNDPENQINAIRSCLSNPYSHWKWHTIWSIEARHDAQLNRFRLQHFHRWPRESVRPEISNYRDSNPETDSIYFPGANATHDAKCTWAGMVVEESVGNNLRPAFDSTWERDDDIPDLDQVGVVLSDILYACAPETIAVCLYIDRKMIDSFIAPIQMVAANPSAAETHQNPGVENIRTFLSSSFIREDAPKEVTMALEEAKHGNDTHVLSRLEKFKYWLQKAKSRGNLHQEPILTKLPPPRYNKLSDSTSRCTLEQDLVLLAKCDNVPKYADTSMVLDDLIDSLGLCDDLVCVVPSSNRNPFVHGYAYITRDVVGENLHYPDEDGTTNGTTSIAFTWSTTVKVTEIHVKERQYKVAFETEFVRRAIATKEASNGELQFLLWPREEPSSYETSDFTRINGYICQSSTTAVTSTNSHIVWLPGEYETIEDSIMDMLLNPTPSSTPFFHFTNTNDGNIFWGTTLEYFYDAVVNEEMIAVNLAAHKTIPNKYCLKLCQLLSLVRTLSEADEHLLNDHDFTLNENDDDDDDDDDDNDNGDEDNDDDDIDDDNNNDNTNDKLEENGIQKFFVDFANEWSIVLSQNDETLRLGVVTEDKWYIDWVTALTRSSDVETDGTISRSVAEIRTLSEQAPGRSREGLYAMLEFYQCQIEDKVTSWLLGLDININVSFVPSQTNEIENEDENEDDNEDESMVSEDHGENHESDGSDDNN